MIDRAARANNLLMDEFFNEEMGKIIQNETNTIVHSNPEDIDQREEAYRTVRAVKAIRSHFESIAAKKMMDKKRFKIL